MFLALDVYLELFCDAYFVNPMEKDCYFYDFCL